MIKHKLFAVGVCLTLVFAQFSFAFAQNQPARSTDELVAMLNEPEAVIVINIRKMLSEIAPTLLNRDAVSLDKLATAMQMIEAETGVNPYSLDRIALGMKFSGKPDSFMMIIQSDSSAKMAESVYQNQLNTAKLANEVNPLKEKIFQVENRIENETRADRLDGGAENTNQNLDKYTTAALELSGTIDNLTRTKSNQPAIDALKDDTDKIRQMLEAIRLDFNKRVKVPDFIERIKKLENQAKAITLKDAQRAAKIAAIGKELTTISLEADDYKSNADDANFQIGSYFAQNNLADTLEKSKEAIVNLPTSEVERGKIYGNIRKDLAPMQKDLDSLYAALKNSSAVPPPPVPVNAQKSEIYPFSTVVTRKDEDFAGKKIMVITTVKKYGGDTPDKVETSAVFPFDERTLMLGERQTIIDSLNNKNADRSRTARDLINKSGDALVAFGVDLKAYDLKDFVKLIGEQKNAWQIFGSLSSQSNDLTVEAVFEKSDRPLVVAAKTDKDEPQKLPDLAQMADKNYVTDLMDLTLKSIVGVEGKLTLRFEKKKAVALLIEDAPKLFRK